MRLVFVLLDVLLLVHRLTKLYIELDRTRLSPTPYEGRLWALSDGCEDGISVLPVDGVESAAAITEERETALPSIDNCVGFESREDEDDVVFESITNSLASPTLERCGSNNISSTATRRHPATGSRLTQRRRSRSLFSPDIVPRLVCLIALLAALFYARLSTMSRGVLWLRGALPSKPSSMSTSATIRHFVHDVGIGSLANDFRQLQAFVDFFNRGKSVKIFIMQAVSIHMPNMKLIIR